MGQELDNNFLYVMVAARRARQLQNGSPALVASRSAKPCKVAQDEITAGKVSYVKGKAAAPKLDAALPDGVPLDVTLPDDSGPVIS